jgi:choline dehydrogenase-like flavoprotein
VKNNKALRTDILIIGSGAGAVGLLSELRKKNYNIIIAEKGGKDLKLSDSIFRKVKKIYKPNGFFPKSIEGIQYYKHTGLGGTIEISCANGVRPSKNQLSLLGIDIDQEIEEVEHDLMITEMPETHIGSNSQLLIDAAERLGIEFKRMTKFINFKKCKKCALCELICPYDAKWSSRNYILDFENNNNNNNIKILHDLRIEKIEINNEGPSIAIGVNSEGITKIIAEKIVLAAGAIDTAIILLNSGISAGTKLFLDLYVVVYGQSEAFSNHRDIPMPVFYSDPDDSFIIAPYLDVEIWQAISLFNLSESLNSSYFNGLMVKIADDAEGKINRDGSINKNITERDRKKLNKGIKIAKDILHECGIDKNTIRVSEIKGAHPGATAAIDQVVNKELSIMNTNNLYIADASILPFALGKPPIVTIMALAKKLGKNL